ncbi:MAG TPA: prenyltransferase/squalene oxidase repeat-containing protein [Terracidiphilus sp.]|nr:prenyltransferase/squalene oxidase repeat-containing protein [Terracidiphilus sp.]
MRHMLATASLFAAVCFGQLAAQNPSNSWQGTIQSGAERQRVVLQMTKSDQGVWQARTLFIEFVPDPLTVDASQLHEGHLHFSTAGGKGVFDGSISADGQVIKGSWRYDKIATPLELKIAGNATAWKVPFLYQYHYRETTYYRPFADEPRIPFNAKLALTYLEQGAVAWTDQWHCVACHTNGSYMVVRPMLSSQFGVPQKELRDFFITALREQMTPDPDDPRWHPEPTQVVYIAAGLAIWDANVTHALSPETAQALDLMFKLQRESGDWYIDDDNNPPLESNTYQLATVAARAVANAPGWRARQSGTPNEAHIQRLEDLLRSERKPQGDYDRTDLLWTASEYPGLLDANRIHELTEMVLNHQQPDGGWSIRTFAHPEEWGKGNRAQKLREEPEFLHPPSDGHMTGLAIIALRKAGVPASDPRIQRGVAWLLNNQRASGRWYTRSLNRDGWQFITYSGTAYPLLALSMCNSLGAEPRNGF